MEEQQQQNLEHSAHRRPPGPRSWSWSCSKRESEKKNKNFMCRQQPLSGVWETAFTQEAPKVETGGLLKLLST